MLDRATGPRSKSAVEYPLTVHSSVQIGFYKWITISQLHIKFREQLLKGKELEKNLENTASERIGERREEQCSLSISLP
jgi:hypothetical protein